MPDLLVPGVYIEKVSERFIPIQRAKMGVAAFLGVTEKGPLHEGVRVDSGRAFREVFGEYREGFLTLAVDGFLAGGGKECVIVSVARPQDEGALTPGHLLGSSPSLEGRTGLFALETAEDVEVVAIPDAARILGKGKSRNEELKALYHGLVAHAERTGTMMAILDPPPHMPPDDLLEWRSGFDSPFAALYYPWVRASSGRAGGTVEMPPSGFVAACFAAVASEEGVHRAPANRALEGVVDLSMEVTPYEQSLLNPRGVNCLRYFPGRGVRIWGARTLSSKAEFRYVNVRRIISLVRRSLETGTQWAVFEPNDETLWKKVTRNVRFFLLDLWKDGFFAGEREEEAFFVKCDEENNPPEERDRGNLFIDIGVAPVRPAEFILVLVKHQYPPVEEEKGRETRE